MAMTPFVNRCVRSSSRSSFGESSFALSDAGRHDPQVVFVDEFGVEQRPIIYFGLALPVVVSSAAD